MLAEFPVTRLHLAAQRVAFSTLGSATTSLGVLWANWVGLIGDISLLGLNLGGETVVGAGILASVAGVRWSVGRWEKARRKFWADWERVGKGLGRDLTVRFFSIQNPDVFIDTSCEYRQATLDKRFDKHIAYVPTAVCDQLEGLEKKRREELAELQGQVNTLLRDSRNLHSG